MGEINYWGGESVKANQPGVKEPASEYMPRVSEGQTEGEGAPLEVEERRVKIGGETPELDRRAEIRDSARIAVRDRVFPGVIFDSQTMNEAISGQLEFYTSPTGQKDNQGQPILEVVVKTPRGDKVVGFASNDDAENYISVKPAEQN